MDLDWVNRRAWASAAIGQRFEHVDVMRMFNDDPETDCRDHWWEKSAATTRNLRAVDQASHEEAVVGFIAGVTAPPGKRMGTRVAIISAGRELQLRAGRHGRVRDQGHAKPGGNGDSAQVGALAMRAGG